MLILSHRGFWLSPLEKNTLAAFERSFQQGFGLETDIRDYQGGLVVSHDIPDAAALSFDDFLQVHRRINARLPLALNVKADGLQALVKNLLNKYDVTDYFTFDMSVPDMLGYLNADINVFTRHSEYEPNPACYGQADGVWLDGFHGEWWSETLVEQHLEQNKKVCIVSPELHRRAYLPTWKKIKSYSWCAHPNVMLCTDFPQQALAFFHG